MAWLIANAIWIGTGLIALPYLIGDFWAYSIALYFLYAIACLGVGLSWGQAGLLSLGQGFFVGIGAYLSGLTLIRFSDSILIYPLLVLCVIFPGILAYLIGRMIFRGRAQNGAFFALITLALVLLAAQIATSWNSVTGGYNGLSGIPGIPGMDGFEVLRRLSGSSMPEIIFVTAFTTMLHATTNYTVDVILAVLLLVGGVVGAQVGARIGAKLNAEQLRILLAGMVLLVCGKLALDLLIMPSELFSIGAGAAH